jgi:hypothetical protein
MYNIKLKICIIVHDLLEGTGIFFLVDKQNELFSIEIDEKKELGFEIYKKIKETLGISVKYNNVGWVDYFLYDCKFDNDKDFSLYYKVIIPEKMKVLIGDYRWMHLNQISDMEEQTRLQTMKAISIM